MDEEIINTYKVFEKSFSLNIIFWITYLIIIIIISLRYNNLTNPKCQIFNGIFTTIITILFGYWIHVLSHKINYSTFYLKFLKSDSIISKILNILPDWLNKIIYWIFYYILDFHSNIHHNSKINKKWYNIIIEFIENICSQSILLIILLSIINPTFKIMNCDIKLNKTLILVWGLIYTSLHLINYNIINCEIHNVHHQNSNYNFGPDPVDILFNSKKDINNIENFNHGVINLIIICILIIIFKDYNTKNKVINYIQNILK